MAADVKTRPSRFIGWAFWISTKEICFSDSNCSAMCHLKTRISYTKNPVILSRRSQETSVAAIRWNTHHFGQPNPTTL